MSGTPARTPKASYNWTFISALVLGAAAGALLAGCNVEAEDTEDGVANAIAGALIGLLIVIAGVEGFEKVARGLKRAGLAIGRMEAVNPSVSRVPAVASLVFLALAARGKSLSY